MLVRAFAVDARVCGLRVSHSFALEGPCFPGLCFGRVWRLAGFVFFAPERQKARRIYLAGFLFDLVAGAGFEPAAFRL
ncbi:hypothetical protein D3C87_2158580 [compost metagenome]